MQRVTDFEWDRMTGTVGLVTMLPRAQLRDPCAVLVGEIEAEDAMTESGQGKPF